jgi:hypothetical protein
MYRRRRRPDTGIHFSFDSFLDVVANVIGIIIKLILVAWVGSRVYKGPPPAPLPPLPELKIPHYSPPPEDGSLAQELDKQQNELARLRQSALEALRDWEASRHQREEAAQHVTDLRQQRETLEAGQPEVGKALAAQKDLGAKAAFSLAQLEERNQKLRAELETLQKAPHQTKQLTYRLPISAPVQSEELFLECKYGRVTAIDLAALLDEIQSRIRDKAEKLKSAWSIEEVTAPQGPFRLRYTLERERGLLEGAPNNRGAFRYGMTGWTVEPVLEPRGETAEEALKPGSKLRKVLDALDPRQTVVTLWVYPDSFPLYRQLRDYLHDHDIVVAGRPLPDGYSIASSRKGTTSRGQ